MKFKGLVALAFSFVMGCSSQKIVLQGDILVKYSDNKFFYYYAPIKNTGFYVVGKGIDSDFARGEAMERLNVLETYFRHNLEGLSKVDKYGEIEGVIEDMEYRMFFDEKIPYTAGK